MNDALLDRHRAARRRALRAAAAVATTALSALACSSTVAPIDTTGDAAPADVASASDAPAVAVDVATAADSGSVSEDTPAVIDAGLVADSAVARADVSAADGGSLCDACGSLLQQDQMWPACTPEYLSCLNDAERATGESCPLACAAWGPFVPPAMVG